MAATRKMRGFRRWMKNQGIECSDALLLRTDAEGDTNQSLSISVKALCDLHERDVVALIPKHSCLTVKTSAAAHLIDEAQLDGILGLAFVVMYEKSLGPQSKWFQYLQLLPPFEPIPLLWSSDEVDSLLAGTELHKTVKEDKALVYQDWKECIKPLLSIPSLKLNPEFFTLEQYLAAKSLIASRSFTIDDYHGSGMVPLADLFNHKTAAEDVHFTCGSPTSESDTDAECGVMDDVGGHHGDDEPLAKVSYSEMGGLDDVDLELSSSSANDQGVLEMIIVKDVKAGAEVFNTYGYLGNAALLHRYGFTEPDNPFDIINIDLNIVLQWSLSLFSCRHSRRRLSLWRKLDYSGCISENAEYFEVSFNGEPQVELLVLLHIMLLDEEEYFALDHALSAAGEDKGALSHRLLGKRSFPCVGNLELGMKLLLTRSVRQALLSLADAREHLYGSDSLEEDIKSFEKRCQKNDCKRYHSLMLRISERRIIERLRCFAASGGGVMGNAKGAGKRKIGERA